jgi:hypothetical protein
MNYPQVFNFRHLLNELGIPLSNKGDWQAGQVLRKLAADHGIQPLRLMTDKTDPDPTVAAQHVIAHYPMEFYAVAKAHFVANFEEERKQIGMFE